MTGSLSYQEQIDKQKNTVAYYHPGIWGTQQMNTDTETDPLQPDIQGYLVLSGIPPPRPAPPFKPPGSIAAAAA